ncbi:MAG: hypothetical protein AAFV59_03775 [Pseudomonadota bacterium]
MKIDFAKEHSIPFRVVVVGCSGSGKTTFATRLASALDISHIELDLLNWRPGWHDRYVHEFDAFQSDLALEISHENWVLAGGYTRVRSMIFARASIVVWLDLPKHIVLRQVVFRSLMRVIDRQPILNGNRERFWQWFTNKGHPIQIVLFQFAQKRVKIKAQLDDESAAHLIKIRCRSRQEVADAFATLTSDKKARV